MFEVNGPFSIAILKDYEILHRNCILNHIPIKITHEITTFPSKLPMTSRHFDHFVFVYEDILG